MYKNLKEQIAAFRYSLISGIVNRDTPLIQGEISAYFNEVAAREHYIPGSRRTQVAIRTLERFKKLYEQYGLEGLEPKQRVIVEGENPFEDILKEAVSLKKIVPERSIDQILFILKSQEKFMNIKISASSVARHFRKNNLTRENFKEEIGEKYGYKRFEAKDIHYIWQFDFQHTLYLPDPKNPKKKKKAILFLIIDDFSRYIVHAQFYWDERTPRMEDSLKKAILKFGVPEQFYCDNGSAFSSHHLKKICSRLGIRLVHSRPYKPQGRGKCERVFRFVDTSFKPEAYLAIEAGHIITLEELNDLFYAWLDGYYHLRKHGTTKISPKDRLSQSTRQTRKCSLEELRKTFYWEEERKADKTSCISLSGNQYEVDDALCGKKITLLYDPFDLSIIEVWYMEKQYANAKLLELSMRVHKKALEPDKSNSEAKSEKREKLPKVLEESICLAKDLAPDDTLSFIKAVKKQQQQQWEEISLNYSDLALPKIKEQKKEDENK